MPRSWQIASQSIEELTGWKKSTHSARKFSRSSFDSKEITSNTISELTGAKLSMVSVGPARGQTIIL